MTPLLHVIRPPADHPVLGYELCPVVGCMAAVVAGRLCYGCRQRFRRFDGTFEEFVAIPRVFALSRRGEQRLCIVCRTPGHERPAAGRNGLCLSCDSGRRVRGPDRRRVRRERGAASFVRALRSLRALGGLQRPSVVHGLPFSLGRARQAGARGVRGDSAAPLARGKPWDRGRPVRSSRAAAAGDPLRLPADLA